MVIPLVAVMCLLSGATLAASPGPPPSPPGSSGGCVIGTAGGQCRDAAAAIQAESSAMAAVTSEVARAVAAEGGKLPSGTLFAGMPLSSAPSPQQVAAALGTIAQDADASISSQAAATSTGFSRELMDRYTSRPLDPRDYGALGANTAVAIGTAYGSNLAQLASYTIPKTGRHPFAWATNAAYGLTFTMWPDVPAPAGSTVLSFVEHLAPLELSSWAATVAEWQDPSFTNFLLAPGMLVSGPCVAPGTTVTGWPVTIVRQGELIPGSTDWAPNTAYAANAMVWANGNFYIATTAGTSASAGPSGTGTGIVDGGATWQFATYGESVRLPSGIITLSQGLSSACPAGAAITFTIAPSQLQALTADYLGIQSAVAQAWSQTTGGRVELGRGMWWTNHPLMNPVGETDTSRQFFNVEIAGEGTSLTQINQTVDFGQDQCAMAESVRGLSRPTPTAPYLPNTVVAAGQISFVNGSFYIVVTAGTTGGGGGPTGQGNPISDGSAAWAWDPSPNGKVSSNSAYADLRLRGPSGGHGFGVSPHSMDGLCVGGNARMYRFEPGGYHGGIAFVGDHQELHGVVSGLNGYGLFASPYTNTMGNQSIEDGSLAGNFIASVGVACSNQIDSTNWKNVHTGFSPYGFYSVPCLPTHSFATNALLSNSTLTSTWIEAVGEAWLKGSDINANVGNNILINVGGNGIGYGGQRPDGRGGVVGARGLIDLAAFTNNTMLSTTMGAYDRINTAMVIASGDCGGNTWTGDSIFIHGNMANGVLPQSPAPSAAIPSFKCGSMGLPNRWSDLYGTGEFHQAGGNFGLGTPFQFVGNGDFIDPQDQGRPLLGFAAAPCNIGDYCAVQTSGRLFGVPVLGRGSIGQATPVHVDSWPSGPNWGGGPGIEAGMDVTDAIGETYTGCTGTCTVLMQATMALSAPGAATGLTATGTDASTAVPLYRRFTTFSSVPAGTGFLLGMMPTGESETVCNDDPTNDLSAYPPSGHSFTGAAAPKVAHGGGCTAFFRTGPITWRAKA